jgi:hypothetical protein
MSAKNSLKKSVDAKRTLTLVRNVQQQLLEVLSLQSCSNVTFHEQ